MMNASRIFVLLMLSAVACNGTVAVDVARADDPAKGATKKVDLGGDVTLELVYIPPANFKWAALRKRRHGPQVSKGERSRGRSASPTKASNRD